MKVFLEIAEAAERLDELLDLDLRGDDVLICRAGNPVAELLAVPRAISGRLTMFGR